jgi:integrase
LLRPDQMPEFPEVKYELGFRTTITKTTQEAILNNIHEMSFHINPKIWLGIKWLCTYISIRPGEMIRLKEKHIDLENRYLIFPDPKEKKPKLVPILDEDVELIKSFSKGFPELPFFRHVKGLQSIKDGQPFGKKYFYKWWVKACKELGIKGVDMYGGTRHSSAIALRKYRTPEEIKRATMHSTNKAFERGCATRFNFMGFSRHGQEGLNKTQKSEGNSKY